MRFETPTDKRAWRTAGPFLGQTAWVLAIVAVSAGLLWLVGLYASGLRDPRYLDGWVLAGGMALQISFHVAVKTARLSPASAKRWRKFHIVVGYVLIVLFLSHSDFSLPDTAFEWAMWICFVLVTLSGLFGTYLAWSRRARYRIDDGISPDRIPVLRAELAQRVQATVADADAATAAIALPGLPHDGWIKELYATRLRAFFQDHRNFTAHLLGAQHPLRRLTDEIDGLSRYVDQQGQDKLAVIKNLVIEKDRLDFAHVHFSLTRGWLLVHVPVTYALIVLTVLHVLVAYAYSSGAW